MTRAKNQAENAEVDSAVAEGTELPAAENENVESQLPAQAQGTEVATTDDEAFDWKQDAGAGFEGADKDSFAIPFLRVIQKMSPQVDEASGEYRPDARPGMFFNTVTGKLYDGKEGIFILPVTIHRRYLRWGPRGGDGVAYRGEYMPEDIQAMISRGEIKEMDGRLYSPMPDGTIDEKKCDRFVDTRSHFVIMIEPDGGMTQALIALASTQIKKSKKLSSMLQGIVRDGVTPPTWLNRVKATTVIENNEQGSWSGLRFELDGFVNDKKTYMAGKKFHEALMAGEVAADYAKSVDETATEGAPSGGF